MSAIPKTESYPKIIPFELIVNKKEEKKDKVRYNKDGTIDKRKCNITAGESSEVYAFKTKEEIEAMINILDKRIEEADTDGHRQIACRNKLLFLVGINLGIRASDLRTLKYSFFLERKNGELKFRDFYILQPMKQRKQKKFVKLFFNQAVQTAVNNYIEEYPIDNLDDYLFPSRKGNEPISTKALWRIIKDTAIEAGIEQNIGSHSLRKTFGYWMWHNAEDKNKALVILQKIFNHSSTLTTSIYIGILDDEMEDMFNSIDLGLDFI